jgi:branched-chain amino acid transport system substrate-binding protein
MIKKILWVVIVLVIVIGAVSWFKTSTPTGDIKIGGLFALTGKWAVGGETEANFIKIAIDEINAAGGINGRKINFILEDDKCSGKDAVSAASKLINVDKVKLILGPSCTAAATPVVAVTDEAKVLIVAATVTAKGIFDKNKYAFRTSPASTDAAALIGELAKTKYNLKNVAMLTESTDFSRSWSGDFASSFEAKGGKIAMKEEFVTGTTDFKTVLLKISSDKDIDGVYLSAQTPADAAVIVKQMKEIGLLKRVQIIGNPTTIDTPVNDASGKALPASAYTVIPFADNQALLKKYVDRYGTQPGFQFFYTAANYDMVYILKDAIQKCGERSASCVKDFLINDVKNWKGQVANWSFDKNGDPIVTRGSYREVQIVDGKKVFTEIK